MNRSVILGLVVGGAIGSVGYNTEIIARGQASIWNFLLAAGGIVGLLGVWYYMVRFRR